MKLSEVLAGVSFIGTLVIGIYLSCKDSTQKKYNAQTKGLSDLVEKNNYTYLDNNNDGTGWAK